MRPIYRKHLLPFYLLLTNELNADIRDMEGCAIIQTAIKADIPVCSFKAISDVAKSGNTTDQYLKNRSKALENLKNELKTIFLTLCACIDLSRLSVPVILL